MSSQLPRSTAHIVRSNATVRVHTLISPRPMFANATHIIELSDQLILIDGQFFAQYGREFRELADSLKKPISKYELLNAYPSYAAEKLIDIYTPILFGEQSH